MNVKRSPSARAHAERFNVPVESRRHDSGTLPIVRPRASRAPLPAQPNVLVVGIVPTLTWSVARALTLAGHKPVVLGRHSVSPMRALPGLHYVRWQNVRWFDEQLDPLLVDQIEDVCRAHAIDVVVPVDYPTILLLSDFGQGVKSARVSAVPHAELMRLLHDKWQFSQILSRLGLPQPRTELAYDASTLASTPLPFPIVTKPPDRWGGMGFQIHHSRDQLEQRIVEAGLAAQYPLIVQEFIPGQDVGIAFVARHGHLVAHAAFEQPHRGSRRYFEAPRLRRYVATLLHETGYHGVGQIDTRYDPATDEYHLLEVNPRFWASQLYAARAGANFPDMLVRLDELPDNGGFPGQNIPVRLSAFESAAARSVLLAERAYDSFLRWRNEQGQS